MKNILNTINILIVFASLNTYCQILDMSKLGNNGLIPSGAYYKDTNNLFNQFEGKYKYDNGNTSLEIELVKKLDQPIAISGSYMDIVVGEFKYIENGVLKINTLPKLNLNISFLDHAIFGFGILNNHNDFPCTTCYPDQKRLRASYQDPFNDKISMDLFFKKVTLPSGIVTLEMFMVDRTRELYTFEGNKISAGLSIFPKQTYVLIKQ